MKTTLTKSALAIFLFPLFSVMLVAQNATQNSSPEKKIVIVKKSVDSEGSEVTETIVKKGKAAENFDVEKYLRENKTATTDVDIRVENGSEVTFHDYESNDAKGGSVRSWSSDDEDDEDYGSGNSWGNGWSNGSGFSFSGCGNDDSKGFLGVEEDSDEDSREEGLTVQVIRNSAAAKAGLKTNDLILKINDSKIDRWADLSAALKNTKPGDKVNLTFSRDGKTQTAETTLTKHSEVTKFNCENKFKRGFLGVNEAGDDDRNEPGVRVTIVKNSGAAKAGLRSNDEILKLDDTQILDFEDISDFMNGSEPGQKIKVTYNRQGQQNTVEAIAGDQQESWGMNWGNVSISDKEKEACLGVYTQSWASNDREGAKIDNFTSESAAREAQMQTGDIITAINGQPVVGHSELWDEISKYKTGEKVAVAYLREGQAKTVEATLKACKDKSSTVKIWENQSGSGENNTRQFNIFNWNEQDNARFRERKIITIRKGEGDAPIVNQAPQSDNAAARTLNLANFRAYPNPSDGQVTIEFRGEPVSTTVSLFDMAGRQLYSEELNGFDGQYNQQFDLQAYAKGTILVQIKQGDKVYTDRIVLN